MCTLFTVFNSIYVLRFLSVNSETGSAVVLRARGTQRSAGASVAFGNAECPF